MGAPCALRWVRGDGEGSGVRGGLGERGREGDKMQQLKNQGQRRNKNITREMLKREMQ